MSLPSGGFAFGSASSAQSVRDVIASYRRAQLLVVESTLASSPDVADSGQDEVSTFEDNDTEEEEHESDRVHDRRPSYASQSDDGMFSGQLDWDGFNGSPHTEISATPFLQSAPQGPFLGPVNGSPPLNVDEEIPLLRHVSFSASTHTRYPIQRPPSKRLDTSVPLPQDEPRHPVLRTVVRRISSGSVAQSTTSKIIGGQSTFGQTLFNSIAILCGIGMLSEPLAFSYAGWTMGTVLIMAYGFVSCYTAKLLARIILSDSRLRSYTDIGRKAFGPKATLPISLLFCLELFSVSVILVTLYADSLNSIIPYYSSNTYKIWGILILTPTVFLPLSLLSYTSVLGIISNLLIIIVILLDGILKKERPGSLWQPMDTSFGFGSTNKLGLAFGLFMAGFSGHAVIPSLARDMEDPSQFDTMINWAFVAATFISALIGYAGYIMFGSQVSEEVSMDLLGTPGYNPLLNQACLWMLVISPLSKFALTTQPLNTTISILLGVDVLPYTPEDAAKRLTTPSGALLSRKRLLGSIQRVVVTLLAVGVSIGIPDFSSLMAFLGSFSAFMICVIGPISAHIAINGRCSMFDGLALVLAVIMAAWGTLAAVFST